MASLNIVIIGAGTVGTALAEYLAEYKLHVELHDPRLQKYANLAEADIIHITVPYFDQVQYMEMWGALVKQLQKNPMIIINSTLNPHILSLISKNPLDIYYSPTRGPEDTMLTNISNRDYYVAPLHKSDNLRMKGYLYQIQLCGIFFDDPYALAYGKLMETTNYGLQIAFTQMMKRVCEEYGWNFEEAYYKYQTNSVFQRDYRTKDKNNVIPRPIFFPGKIGGKCVMQNLKIIDDNHLADLSFIEFILDSNDKVKEA